MGKAMDTLREQVADFSEPMRKLVPASKLPMIPRLVRRADHERTISVANYIKEEVREYNNLAPGDKCLELPKRPTDR